MAFSTMEKDLLKELANIGMGHAAISLSQLVNRNVDISLPELTVIPVGSMCQGDHDIALTASGIAGQVKGLLAIVLSKETAFKLVDQMYGFKDGTTNSYGQDSESALKEFCNIIGGAFLSSLSDFLQLDLMPKIPIFSEGHPSKVREEMKKYIFEEVDDVLSVKTEMYIGGEVFEGRIYLILDASSFEKIIQKMSGSV